MPKTHNQTLNANYKSLLFLICLKETGKNLFWNFKTKSSDYWWLLDRNLIVAVLFFYCHSLPPQISKTFSFNFLILRINKIALLSSFSSLFPHKDYTHYKRRMRNFLCLIHIFRSNTNKRKTFCLRKFEKFCH